MKNIILVFLSLALLASCSNKRYSSASSWEYSDSQSGGFASEEYKAKDIEELNNDRMVMYDASMRLKVKKLEGQAQQAVEIAKAKGGFMVNISDSFVRLRVPAESLKQAMDEIAGLGKLDSRNISGSDVTDNYSDFKLRLENAEKTRDRYLEILAKAEQVSDILLIEKELERINLNIERYKGMMNGMDKRVKYSSLNVYFKEKPKLGPLGFIFYNIGRGIKWLFVRG